MIANAALQIMFDAWRARKGYDLKDLVVVNRQERKQTLAGFADKGPLTLKFPGKTAFVSLVEAEEVGGGSTTKSIIDITSSNDTVSYEEWSPNMPPIGFVTPIVVCNEFFSIDVANKTDLTVVPSGNLIVYVQYIMVQYIGTPKEGLTLI